MPRSKLNKNLLFVNQVTLPLWVVVAAVVSVLVLAVVAWGVYMQHQPRTPISYAQEKIIRDKLFAQHKTQTPIDEKTCPAQPTLRDQQSFEYKNIRINRTGDRAILQRCDDTGDLLAKTSGGKWFIISSIDPRPIAAQDYDVRRICKIEDITIGFNDLFPENQSLRQTLLHDCRNIDATYRQNQPKSE